MVYFYYGDNAFGIKRQIDSIKEQFTKKYGQDNVIKLNTLETESTISELVNAGLFSSNRLVILENVFSNKNLIEKLPDALLMLPQGTDLIITDTKPDKRTKLYKALLRREEVQELTTPKNLRQFVIDEAARQKVQIDRAAIDDLTAYTAGDMWRIANEINKFESLNIPISPINLKRFVEPDLAANVFEILDDLFNQQAEKTLKKIAILKQNEDPNKFFALLSNQVFVLSVAKSSKKSKDIVARETGVHPYAMSKMLDYAPKISWEKLGKISEIIAETDAKIKLSNKEGAWLLVEMAINKIILKLH